MVSPINSALSGLAAAGKRMQVAADNLANEQSTETSKDGVVSKTPYVPQDVVQISQANGGVSSVVRDAQNPVVKQYNPEHPDADEAGFVSLPNVDQAEQLVNMQTASYDFKANLKAIQVADKMQQSLLDIIS